jgi:hypothetical protein
MPLDGQQRALRILLLLLRVLLLPNRIYPRAMPRLHAVRPPLGLNPHRRDGAVLGQVTLNAMWASGATWIFLPAMPDIATDLGTTVCPPFCLHQHAGQPSTSMVLCGAYCALTRVVWARYKAGLAAMTVSMYLVSSAVSPLVQVRSMTPFPLPSTSSLLEGGPD